MALSLIRAEMSKRGLDAYIIPAGDDHMSEYIAESDKRRAFLSGFTGSAGTAVVTAKKAALWTDSRYWLQAVEQLSSDWVLMKDRLANTVPLEAWLNSELPPKQSCSVGYDPSLMSKATVAGIERVLKEKGHVFAPVAENLVDIVR